MKFILTVLIFIFTQSAFANQYSCTGIDRSSGASAKIEFINITNDNLTAINLDGDKIKLDHLIRKNESKFQYAVYADDDYDGYGSYIRAHIPKDLISSDLDTEKPFLAFYWQVTYSELGQVSEVDIKANCVKNY